MAKSAAKEITVTLPTLHPGQVEAFRQREDPRGGEWVQNGAEANGGRARFKVVRCGRRWGKTVFGETRGGDALAKGRTVGWFAPEYKFLNEVYEEVHDICEMSGLKKSSNKTNGVIRTRTGGRIDFWSLDNDRAGRSRKYHLVILDEAAYTNPNMMDIWKKSIKPTLYDYGGDCLVASNTNGVAPDNFLWQICNQPEHGFIEFHAPTWHNPTIPTRLPGESEEAHAKRRLEEIEKIRSREHPLVFAQEYAAEFVDWSGVAFFDQGKFLENGLPVGVPTKCDYVFAVIDTAVKTGKKNDGTAITFYARNLFAGPSVVILDWDIIQVDGDLLEVWLKTQFEHLEHWSKRCGARRGSVGAFIEDKASGMVLNMAAQRRGWPAHAIDSTLTSVGKDERALSVSGYHYRGECKMTEESFNKRSTYKGVERNQFLAQVCGFRIGVPDQADDLTDTYTYGLAIALGDREGI